MLRNRKELLHLTWNGHVTYRRKRVARTFNRSATSTSDNIVTCISVAREQLGKHIPTKTNYWQRQSGSITRQRNCKHAII
jgi:hypothetical protein